MSFTDTWLPVLDSIALVGVTAVFRRLHIQNADTGEVSRALVSEVIRDVDALTTAHNALADHSRVPAAKVEEPPASKVAAASALIGAKEARP